MSHCVAGRPIYVFSAMPGTRGAELLEAIRTGRPSKSHPRTFSVWAGDVASGTVEVNGKLTVHITLRLGVKAGVHLQDEPSLGRKVSMKALPGEDGVLVLSVGSGSQQSSSRRYRSAASQIIATFVAHGEGWQDRSRHTFLKPYGEDKKDVQEAGRDEVVHALSQPVF